MIVFSYQLVSVIAFLLIKAMNSARLQRSNFLLITFLFRASLILSLLIASNFPSDVQSAIYQLVEDLLLFVANPSLISVNPDERRQILPFTCMLHMINKMDLFDQLKYGLLENFIYSCNILARFSSRDLSIKIFKNIPYLSFILISQE